MSFLQSLTDFFISLFGASSPEAKKRQEIKKIESELKEIRPVIYKNDMVQPNFAEALRILFENTAPIEEILNKTICTGDIQRNNRFIEQLLLTGFPPEHQELIESFVYENQLRDAMSSDSLAIYFDKKHKDLEIIIKQLNSPELLKIDNTINRLKQLHDIAKFSYVSALRLFDTSYNSLDPRVRGELKAYSEFFDKYRDSKASEVSDKLNEAYLESQGTAGVRSYGMVVDLAVAYYMK